jgi:hypothetical protein
VANYQNDLSQAGRRLDEATTNTDNSWMRSISFGNDFEDCQARLVDRSFGVLIVFSEISGCGSCLQLEATEWQAFLSQDALARKVAVTLICTTRDVARQRQEFNSMHILYPICYDSSATLMKDLDIQWTPRVFFLYGGRIVGGYTAEMNNRDKSKAMMAKFKEFVDLY